jgi:hypothetical protein
MGNLTLYEDGHNSYCSGVKIHNVVVNGNVYALYSGVLISNLFSETGFYAYILVLVLPRKSKGTILQWPPALNARNPGAMRTHLRGYAKTSHGECKRGGGELIHYFEYNLINSFSV